MKKRMIATVLLLVMLVSCCSVVASAETRKNVKHKHDKWVVEKLSSGDYRSTYNDCTAWSCIGTSDLIGHTTHATVIRNNATGGHSGIVYANHTKKAVATVKGTWNDKGATAYIAYTGSPLARNLKLPWK